MKQIQSLSIDAVSNRHKSPFDYFCGPKSEKIQNQLSAFTCLVRLII